MGSVAVSCRRVVQFCTVRVATHSSPPNNYPTRNRCRPRCCCCYRYRYRAAPFCPYRPRVPVPHPTARAERYRVGFVMDGCLDDWWAALQNIRENFRNPSRPETDLNRNAAVPKRAATEPNPYRFRISSEAEADTKWMPYRTMGYVVYSAVETGNGRKVVGSLRTAR